MKTRLTLSEAGVTEFVVEDRGGRDEVTDGDASSTEVFVITLFVPQVLLPEDLLLLFFSSP